MRIEIPELVEGRAFVVGIELDRATSRLFVELGHERVERDLASERRVTRLGGDAVLVELSTLVPPDSGPGASFPIEVARSPGEDEAWLVPKTGIVEVELLAPLSGTHELRVTATVHDDALGPEEKRLGFVSGAALVRWFSPALSGELVLSREGRDEVSTLAVVVKEAPFPFREARERAPGIDPTRGAFAGDAWLLDEGREGSWIVRREGEPRRFPGSELALVGLALARGEALLDAPSSLEGFPLVPGKGSRIAVATVRDLERLLAVLEPRGQVVRGLAVAKPWWSSPRERPEQGARVECVECVIAGETLAGCARCGGAGELFKPAQMLSPESSHRLGEEQKERAPSSREELTGALEGVLLYGTPFALGFLGEPLSVLESPRAGALRDLARARLRLAILSTLP